MGQQDEFSFTHTWSNPIFAGNSLLVRGQAVYFLIYPVFTCLREATGWPLHAFYTTTMIASLYH